MRHNRELEDFRKASLQTAKYTATLFSQRSLYHVTTIQTKRRCDRGLLSTYLLHLPAIFSMSPAKFVLKCGGFAVLVDLHVLPLGPQEESVRFTQQHQEEVCEMIRDGVDQRVRHFQETRHQRGQPKPRRGLTPASPICIKGDHFRLAAYFLKRHSNLRCVRRRHQGELRVFPERLVVCASVPEGAARHGERASLTSMDHGGQSKSEYFSGHHENQNPLNSSAITKRNTLQKIAKKADGWTHPSPRGQQGAPLLSAAMETEVGSRAGSEGPVGGPEEEGMGREEGGSRAQAPTAAPAPEGMSAQSGPPCEGSGPGLGQGLAPPSCDAAEPPQVELSEARTGGFEPQAGREGAKRACDGRDPAFPGSVTTNIRPTDSSVQFMESSPSASRSQPPLGPTRPKHSPKPLLPRNSTRPSRTHRAGSGEDKSVPDSVTKPSEEERLPRKSRLKRVRKT
ncbi:hypothetical protein GJAV_G00237720 [Gymnothorax javanicus]|nr:hypothetical protein GJAV_G00237720 [Gymnothorax javanicus]